MVTTPSSDPNIVVPAYLTLAEAEAYALRVADVSVWSTLSDARKTSALVQASDEIDACQYEGIPYGDWMALRANVQLRAFPRIILDDPALWPAGKLMESAVIWDVDPVGNVIIPYRVKFAAFLQASDILNRPGRKDRLRDREEGVVNQSVGGHIQEQYDPAKPVRLICVEARMQLAVFFRKSARLC
jgi:hypothetical protein